MNEIRAFLASLRGPQMDAFVAGMVCAALIMMGWVLVIEGIWG